MKKDKNSLTEQEFLDQYNINDFERPSITVDNLLFIIDEVVNEDVRKLNDKELQVLLVKRKEHPFIDTWCLPGTFIKMNETLEQAALRTLNTKAKINDIYLEQLYTFDALHRDPRGRILSVSYMALVNKKAVTNNEALAWFTITTEELNDNTILLKFNNKNDIMFNVKLEVKQDNIKINEPGLIGFDHARIIYYGLIRMRNKIEYTDIAFNLLPPKFTLAELQQLYEVILGKKFTKANFQRKIKHKVKPLDEYKTGGFRPAQLYKYKKR